MIILLIYYILVEQLCYLHEQSLAVNVSGSASSKRNEQLKIDNCTHEITSVSINFVFYTSFSNSLLSKIVLKNFLE